MPPGSYLTIWDATLPESSAAREAVRRAQDEYAETGATPYVSRDPDELLSLFEGLDLVEPGFVPGALWRPEEPDPRLLDQYAAMGRKP